MKKVLVTGGNSFIGRHVVSELVEAGIEVTAIYRKNIGLFDSKIDGRNIVFMDISDWDAYQSLPGNYDAIVHIAAVSQTDGIGIDEMILSNISGARNIQRYCLEENIGKLIYTSSISIHGQIMSKVVDHETPVINPAIYGVTKFFGERLFETISNKVPAISIRLPGVLGSGAHRAWIPCLMEKMINNLDVEIYSPDNFFNNAVHVSGLSTFIKDLILYKEWAGYAAFPIGACNPITISRMVDLLRNGLFSKSRISDQQINKNYFLISSELAIQKFGYIPDDMELILNKYIKNYLKDVSGNN